MRMRLRICLLYLSQWIAKVTNNWKPSSREKCKTYKIYFRTIGWSSTWKLVRMVSLLGTAHLLIMSGSHCHWRAWISMHCDDFIKLWGLNLQQTNKATRRTWYFDHLSTLPGLSLLTKAFLVLFTPVLLQVEVFTDTFLTDLKTLTQGSPPGWSSSTEARCPAWGSRMTSSQRCTNFYIGGKFILTFETRVKL